MVGGNLCGTDVVSKLGWIVSDGNNSILGHGIRKICL